MKNILFVIVLMFSVLVLMACEEEGEEFKFAKDIFIFIFKNETSSDWHNTVYAAISCYGIGFPIEMGHCLPGESSIKKFSGWNNMKKYTWNIYVKQDKWALEKLYSMDFPGSYTNKKDSITFVWNGSEIIIEH